MTTKAPTPATADGSLFGAAVGAGEAVVLLHGGLLDHSIFTPLQLELARDHWTLALDLPGFGRSAPPSAGVLDLDDLADTVLEHLSRRHVSNAHLVGLSLGGGVATRMTIRSPTTVASLALFGVGGARRSGRARPPAASGADRKGPDDDFADAMLGPSASGRMRAHVRSLASATPAPTVRALLNLLAAYPPILEELARVGAPLLLATGAMDRSADPAALEEAAGRLPDAQAVTIADAGHLAPYERPVETAALLRRFWGRS